MQSADEILAILDAACESFAFPMLDNGYVYLAATRLSLFRSSTDWALVIEHFGFSPRAGLPDLTVQTFASVLHERNPASNYVNEAAYRNYLQGHPHDEFRSFHPLEDGLWIDEESISDEAGVAISVRGRAMPLPSRSDYKRFDIDLEDPGRVRVFELCRYLAATQRAQILATESEQRVSVLPDMHKLLELEDWHHPDLAAGERASQLDSFRQLAAVLASGDTSHYRPTAAPNTHWKHWPDGGSL